MNGFTSNDAGTVPIGAGVLNTAFDQEEEMEMKKLDNGSNRHITSNVRAVDTEMYGGEYKCGYGSCTPNFLQKCHNLKCLLFTLCLCAITQGIVVNGLIPVSITTLEKRFHLSSTESGLFVSMYDVGVLLVLVPLCYFGGKGHKGRYLGWGMIIMGIGSFICALPQFTTDLYDYGQSALNDTCQVNQGNVNNTDCPAITNDSGSKVDRLRLYLFVLLLGQLFHGIGASPLYTLGITYIDENASQRSSPVYLGLYIGFSTVGPALGFIVGGMLLRIYGDVGKVDLSSVHITSSDPRWYGAWWIGFVICSGLAIMFSLPMLSFARELPEAKENRKLDVDQSNRRTSIEGGLTGNAFNGNLHEIKTSFIRILKNPTFVCLMIMQCAESFLLNGFVAFLPKMVENVFSLSSSTASMITGAILVPFGFAGNVMGGYLIRRFKLLCKGIILLAFAFQSGSAVFVFSLLVGCPRQTFVGIMDSYNVTENGQFETNKLLSTCNSRCGCNEYYQPVCNKYENANYFSACFAGCQTKHGSGGDTTSWTDCKCIQERFKNLTQPVAQANVALHHNATNDFDSVQGGLCPTHCPMMYVFFALFAVEVLLTFCSAMPIQQAELRCVPFDLRTLAVGLRWIFARLIGAIPGLIGFGAAIDTTCIYWEEKCGQRASCLRYDSKRMALLIMGFALAIKTIVVVSLFLAWKFYIAPPSTIEPASPTVKTAVSKFDHARNKITPTSSPTDASQPF